MKDVVFFIFFQVQPPYLFCLLFLMRAHTFPEENLLKLEKEINKNGIVLKRTTKQVGKYKMNTKFNIQVLDIIQDR